MKEKIKVGIFTSGFVSVNKESTKGTEVFTYDLCDGLTKAGSEVHLFGAHDSNGNFICVKPNYSKEVVENISNMYENNVYQIVNFFNFLSYCHTNKIDIIHDQTAELTIGLARCSDIPIVCTLHGVREPGNLSEYYKLNRELYFVSPSEFAKRDSSDLDIHQVINHGIDLSKYPFCEQNNGRLLWVGRIIESKGLIDAIKAIKQSSYSLDIIGYNPSNVGKNPYFDKAMKMIEGDDKFNFIGKVDHNKIANFMAQAKALIMPTRCHECFGLVIIEAMACGTPVIAYDNGAISEIIENGKTGFYVSDGDWQGLSASIEKVKSINRKDCREIIEKKFSRDLMVERYLNLYRRIIKNTDEIRRNKKN